MKYKPFEKLFRPWSKFGDDYKKTKIVNVKKPLTLETIKKLYKRTKIYDSGFPSLFFGGSEVVFDKDTDKMVTLILAKHQPKDESKRVLDMRYKVNKEFLRTRNEK